MDTLIDGFNFRQSKIRTSLLFWNQQKHQEINSWAVTKLKDYPCMLWQYPRMNDQVIDLEEAVGSYLNCLSTSCAAGSKLYTSVGKLVEDKFQELFPSQETKLLFQTLQTQNAFEGYQKALLECKDKLLEILIDSHTKRQPTKDKSRQGKSKSTEEVRFLYNLFLSNE